MKPVIETHALCKSYHGRPVVDHLNLTVPEGCVYGFLGPNGAGKTTLVRALLSQIPHTGQIRHMDNQERPLRSVRTGYVPQQLPFDKQMPVTVTDFLAASLTRRPVWTGVGKKTRAQVLEALALARAEKLANRQLGQLSGGELQRVLLAMALTPTPDLLVLDEPVTGLDPAAAQDLYRTLDYLNKKEGIAIIMVTHDLHSALPYATAILHAGHGSWFYGDTASYLASPCGKRFGGEA